MAVQARQFGSPSALVAYLNANPSLVVGGIEFDRRRRLWVLWTGYSPGGGSGGVGYTPTTPADWAGSPPTTVQEALDRISSAVAGLLGTPIP